MAKWTRAGIIRDILQREAEGRPLTVSAGDGGIDHLMYQAASRIFGSWRNAVLAAGLPASRSRSNAEWTPARIRRLIRSMAGRKQPLRAKELQIKHGSFLQAARRHFGSWSKAVAASGVDPQQMRRNPSWSKERVIEQILMLSLRNESLDRRVVQPRALADAAARLFGSWKAALFEAGVHFEGDPVKLFKSSTTEDEADPSVSSTASEFSDVACHMRGTRWTRSQVLGHVHRRVSAGQSIRAVDVSQEHCALFSAGRRRFGTWGKTLVAAGMSKHGERPLTTTDSTSDL